KIAIPERPAAPAQLNQYLAGGTTPIAVGGAAGGNPGSTVNVVFKATVTDPDPGDLISIEVEVQTTDVAFDTTTNLHRGAGVVTTGRAAVTVGFSVPLVLSTNYHWHARACDQTNRCSGWVAFGGNVDLDPSSLVYLAYEIQLNRPVALKVLPLQLAYGADAAERFEREAKIAAALDHPHIVPIYRVGATGTFLWYSMKRIKGRSLGEILEQTGTL